MKLIYFILSVFIFISIDSNAQKKEKIRYKADELKFRRIDKEPVRKLINNVIFNQGDTEIRCDSANYYNKKNILEAFGNIIITNPDSSVIRARSLIYDGESRVAKLRKEVIYTKDKEQISTDYLDYFIDEKKGFFFNEGELKDEINTLKSDYGIFYGSKDLSIFYKEVILVGEDYTLKSDSMTYNTITKETITFGYTEIISEDSTYIESLGGSFQQETKNSKLTSSKIETNDYILEADFINFDEKNSTYQASQNVILKIKESDYFVYGDQGEYNKSENITKIFGNTLLKKNIENDTFYLSSDTILAIDDDKDINKLFAYNDVKFYKKNFIGKSDSMIFIIKDSTINMFNDPVIWNYSNQITSDTINFKLYNDQVEEMNLIKNSFIISTDTMGNYNQIKGRDMKAIFSENNFMKHILVSGNGETIYFGLDEDYRSIIGLNYIICSSLKLNFDNNEIDNIIFYNNPIAKMIPPHEIEEGDLYIKSFKWREDEKPKIGDVVFYFRNKIYLRND